MWLEGRGTLYTLQRRRWGFRGTSRPGNTRRCTFWYRSHASSSLGPEDLLESFSWEPVTLVVKIQKTITLDEFMNLLWPTTAASLALCHNTLIWHPNFTRTAQAWIIFTTSCTGVRARTQVSDCKWTQRSGEYGSETAHPTDCTCGVLLAWGSRVAAVRPNANFPGSFSLPFASALPIFGSDLGSTRASVRLFLWPGWMAEGGSFILSSPNCRSTQLKLPRMRGYHSGSNKSIAERVRYILVEIFTFWGISHTLVISEWSAWTELYTQILRHIIKAASHCTRRIHSICVGDKEKEPR